MSVKETRFREFIQYGDIRTGEPTIFAHSVESDAQSWDKLVEFMQARADAGELQTMTTTDYFASKVPWYRRKLWTLRRWVRKNWRDALVLAVVITFFACVLWFAVCDIREWLGAFQ